MAVDVAVVAGAGLAIIIFIIILGFIYYLMRNYWQKTTKSNQKTTSDPKRRAIYDGKMDSSVKTTTDDDHSHRLPTFDQILQKEEKSSIVQGKSLGLYPLKLKQTQLDATSKVAAAPGQPTSVASDSSNIPQSDKSREDKPKNQGKPAASGATN